VIRAAREHRLERQPGPLGDLVGEKPADETGVDVDLVRVHADGGVAYHASRRWDFENRRHLLRSSDFARASSLRSSIASSRWSLR
jgi:hypothetical protein